MNLYISKTLLRDPSTENTVEIYDEVRQNLNRDGVSSALPYKKYVVALNQASTANPTIARTLINEVTGTVSVTRTGVGIYRITFPSGQAPMAKTTALSNAGNNGSTAITVNTYNNIEDVVIIETYNSSGTKADAILSDTVIDVTIYK